VPPLGVTAGIMSIATVATLPLLVAAPPPHAPSVGTVAGLLVLGVGSTGIAFVWWYTVMREVGPGRGALVSYLAPPFAVLYGTVFLDEHLGVGAAVGVVLILAGSWLGVGGRVSRSGPSRSTGRAPARAR
jgi:drug/metabolite transporter (DMT)-like permease